jgi:predicted signal transduction protein with EAL and GGDEF domain
MARLMHGNAFSRRQIALSIDHRVISVVFTLLILLKDTSLPHVLMVIVGVVVISIFSSNVRWCPSNHQ